MRPGAGGRARALLCRSGARPRGAGRERAEESSGERGAREGAGGSCPRAERPRAAGGGAGGGAANPRGAGPVTGGGGRGASPDRSLSLPRRVSSRGRPGLPLPSALPAFPPTGLLPSIGPRKVAAAAAAESEGSSHMNQFLSVSGSGQRRRP